MKKYLGILVVFGLAFGYVWGAIYYDPDTNSYVYTNVEEQPEDTTTTDEDTVDTDTGDVQDDSEDDSQESETTSPVVNYDGPLDDLHDTLDAHATALQKKLQGYYDDLFDQIADVEQIAGGVARIDVLQCLGLIDDELNLEKEIETVYKQLKNQIGISEADIHSDISALEDKIDNDLLDSLMQKLETSSATNKVESFNTEYDNVIDTFKSLFASYISDTDTLVEDTSEDNQDLLEGYDERIALYEDLEAGYDEFVSKSSFAGVVAGPNIQQLYDLRDALRGYYASKLKSEWHDSAVVFVPRYAAERAKLADITAGLELEFATTFDGYADDLLEGLYPVEDLLVLHKSILALRSAYTDKDGQYDCRAFATNRTIEASGPQLEEYMTNVLSNLNKYVNQIADDKLPTDAESLKEGLIRGLSDKSTSIILDIVRRFKDKLQVAFNEQDLTMLSIPVESQRDANEQYTRQLLQRAYLKFLKEDDLDSFYDVLEDANQKLEDALVEDLPSNAEQTLQMIQSVIMEFLS